MQNSIRYDNYRQNGGGDRTNLSSYPKKINMDFLVRDENAAYGVIKKYYEKLWKNAYSDIAEVKDYLQLSGEAVVFLYD